MIIKYRFADGTASDVEVTEELGAIIIATCREEESADRNYRRHCLSLDAFDYEGQAFATSSDPEDEYISAEKAVRVNDAMSHLTEKQQKYLRMLANGLSMREIARREGVHLKTVQESITAGRKKFLKFFSKTPRQNTH